MLKILGGMAGVLFGLARFCLVRATFLAWLAGLWAVVKHPALNLAIKNGPAAVPITLALASMLIVCRFLLWLAQLTSGRHLFIESPLPKRLPALRYHKVGW